MQLIEEVRTFLSMPVLGVNLQHALTAGNDPFYSRVVMDFFQRTQGGHPRIPFVKWFEYGVALCMLPPTFDDYFSMIEASARRNCKKAERLGYRFERIDYNQYLDDVREIRRSADVRQGQLPDSIIKGDVKPCLNPPSTTNIHDYPFFGILKDGKLFAYANCLVSGDVCMLEHILGHADKQEDGIIPMLITGIVRYMKTSFPAVRFYTYGTFFGAGSTMRRFKKKFCFFPHRIVWMLSSSREQLGYREVRAVPISVDDHPEASYVSCHTVWSSFRILGAMVRLYGAGGALKVMAKLAMGNRRFYCIMVNGAIVSHGWVSLSFCRHYRVEKNDVVYGPSWTDPAHRSRGYAVHGMRIIMNEMVARGYRVFFADTSTNNIAAQKLLAHCGFGEPVFSYPRFD